MLIKKRIFHNTGTKIFCETRKKLGFLKISFRFYSCSGAASYTKLWRHSEKSCCI